MLRYVLRTKNFSYLFRFIYINKKETKKVEANKIYMFYNSMKFTTLLNSLSFVHKCSNLCHSSHSIQLLSFISFNSTFALH